MHVGRRKCLWVCLASVSVPMCVFVFIIRVTTRFSLTKIDKVLSLEYVIRAR